MGPENQDHTGSMDAMDCGHELFRGFRYRWIGSWVFLHELHELQATKVDTSVCIVNVFRV